MVPYLVSVSSNKAMDREDQKACIESPLIHITVEDRLKVDSIQLNKDKAIERAELYEEVRKQLWLAGPLVSVSILNYSLQIISVMFVGHLGQLPLSAASMATSFASVTGFSLLVSSAVIGFLCYRMCSSTTLHIVLSETCLCFCSNRWGWLVL